MSHQCDCGRLFDTPDARQSHIDRGRAGCGAVEAHAAGRAAKRQRTAPVVLADFADVPEIAESDARGAGGGSADAESGRGDQRASPRRAANARHADGASEQAVAGRVASGPFDYGL